MKASSKALLKYKIFVFIINLYLNTWVYKNFLLSNSFDFQHSYILIKAYNSRLRRDVHLECDALSWNDNFRLKQSNSNHKHAQLFAIILYCACIFHFVHAPAYNPLKQCTQRMLNIISVTAVNQIVPYLCT